jgi:hypothetical protein
MGLGAGSDSIASGDAADLGVAGLGGDAGGGVDGVVVLEAAQYLRRVDLLAAVQRQQVGTLSPQALQLLNGILRGEGGKCRGVSVLEA